jgi:hypothetical protein
MAPPSGPGPVASPEVSPERRSAATALRRGRRRRAVYALVFLALVLLVGTVGFHLLAGLGWVDSVYFESMLATGQGPPLSLTTDTAKLYASAMAFASVGSTLTTVIFTLGPMVARLWREVAGRIEQDARRFEEELRPHPPKD